MFRLHAKNSPEAHTTLKKLLSIQHFFAVYGIIKNFIIRLRKNSNERILKKFFSLSIKKPFELKFMPGRLKSYLREMCTHIGFVRERG